MHSPTLERCRWNRARSTRRVLLATSPHNPDRRHLLRLWHRSVRVRRSHIVTNAATIVLDGTSSAIINTSNGNALAGFTTNAAGGQFTVQDGGSFTTGWRTQQRRRDHRLGGSTLTVSGAFTQSAGSTILAQGTLTSTTSSVTLAGGLLGGTGTVNSNVNNTGAQISPGTTDAAGKLTIQGTYTQGTGGSLNVALGGLGAGIGYDQLAVTGATSLGGTINVSTINGYVPTVNSSFQVLTFASKTGSFQTYIGLYISRPDRPDPGLFAVEQPDQPDVDDFKRRHDWINPAGGDWDTASNWTYGVPVAGQSVAIPYSGITGHPYPGHCRADDRQPRRHRHPGHHERFDRDRRRQLDTGRVLSP